MAKPVNDGTVGDYAAEARAPLTNRAYQSDWLNFERWCDQEGRRPFPASDETIAAYIAARARSGRVDIATIKRNLTSIRHYHKAAGLSQAGRSRLVADTTRGIERLTRKTDERKSPLLVADVRAMCQHLPGPDPMEIRDRAIILITFAAALERLEVAALDVADLGFLGKGMIVTTRNLRRSQHRGTAKIRVISGESLVVCPVRTMGAHLYAAGIKSGPVFRRERDGGRMSPRALAERVKSAAMAIGKDPATVGAASLRRGFAISALEGGAPPEVVARHARLASVGSLNRWLGYGSWPYNDTERLASTYLGL